MKLKILGANRTEIQVATYDILFSYNTPVAVLDIHGNMFVTECRWSRTTSKHIGLWRKDKLHDETNVQTRPQEFFDTLVIN